MRAGVVAVSLIFLAASMPAWLAAVEKPAFDRYQAIIERSPFGRADAAGSSAVTSNFMARYAFVGVIGSAETGMLAALVDKQTNQSCFKAPGESMGDITIVRIENILPKRRLVLRRGLEVGTLIFGEGAPSSAGMVLQAISTPASKPPEPSTPSVPVPRRRIPFIR